MAAVSVILCAYNSERFLRPAVESVLAQTFKDFELICIDDGAKDSTGKILDEYAAHDSRVKVIHQANTGQVKAAMNGIAVSAAPLIARMDADDICRPDRLAKQVAFMDAHPEIVLLGGAYELIDEKTRILIKMGQPTGDADLQKICLSGRCPICQPLAIFRREAYERVGGYRPDFSPAEDIDLWLRLGDIGQMACLPDVLLQYRQHAGSLSETKQHIQLANIRRAVEETWQRRNLPGQPNVAKDEWRATGDEGSKYRQLVKYGWWAFSSGHPSTARSYGLAAIRSRPFDAAGWKLFGVSLLKGRRAPQG